MTTKQVLTRPFSRSFQTNPKRNNSTPDPVTPLIRERTAVRLPVDTILGEAVDP